MTVSNIRILMSSTTHKFQKVQTNKARVPCPLVEDEANCGGFVMWDHTYICNSTPTGLPITYCVHLSETNMCAQPIRCMAISHVTPF